jgi:hypothetical protein
VDIRQLARELTITEKAMSPNRDNYYLSSWTLSPRQLHVDEKHTIHLPGFVVKTTI